MTFDADAIFTARPQSVSPDNVLSLTCAPFRQLALKTRCDRAQFLEHYYRAGENYFPLQNKKLISVKGSFFSVVFCFFPLKIFVKGHVIQTVPRRCADVGSVTTQVRSARHAAMLRSGGDKRQTSVVIAVCSAVISLHGKTLQDT